MTSFPELPKTPDPDQETPAGVAVVQARNGSGRGTPPANADPDGPYDMNLPGKKMQVVQTAANGVVGKDTVFHFSQQGNEVEARYSGGRITVEFLVGVLEGTVLAFRSCQISDGNKVDGGASQGCLETLSDGRLRLVETFTWESRSGGGENIFDEI